MYKQGYLIFLGFFLASNWLNLRDANIMIIYVNVNLFYLKNCFGSLEF